MPNDYPRNYQWATLIQRKFDNDIKDRFVYGMNWFAVAVHGEQLSVSIPGELHTYVERNQAFISNYGERYRNGERIASGFVESAVNQVVSKRMVKHQQMERRGKPV